MFGLALGRKDRDAVGKSPDGLISLRRSFLRRIRPNRRMFRHRANVSSKNDKCKGDVVSFR
jgi:hypothetical protein